MKSEAGYWHWVLDDPTLTRAEKAVAMALLRHAPNIWPSVGRLAELLGYTRRHTRRILRRLEAKAGGCLNTEHRQGQTNRYRLDQIQLLLFSTANRGRTPVSQGVGHPCPPKSEREARKERETRAQTARAAPPPVEKEQRRKIEARHRRLAKEFEARAEARAGKGPETTMGLRQEYLDYLREREIGTWKAGWEEYKAKRKASGTWKEARLTPADHEPVQDELPRLSPRRTEMNSRIDERRRKEKISDLEHILREHGPGGRYGPLTPETCARIEAALEQLQNQAPAVSMDSARDKSEKTA